MSLVIKLRLFVGSRRKRDFMWCCGIVQLRQTTHAGSLPKEPGTQGKLLRLFCGQEAHESLASEVMRHVEGVLLLGRFTDSRVLPSIYYHTSGLFILAHLKEVV